MTQRPSWTTRLTRCLRRQGDATKAIGHRVIPESRVSIGDITGIEISDSLPYAPALRKIRDEAAGTGVTIDVKNFYSESPVELHNFSSKIVYRFIEHKGVKAIGYLIEDRHLYECTYRELDYQGNLLISCPESTANKLVQSASEKEAVMRAYSQLGLFWRQVESSR
ncbi:hypothetical protein PEC18_01635 [Paucibacter sp. O1-1]|nr:hypothetical protein [Paucibacter sp. O1-1]MDA3824592.1 hypothetical protein [Paucibacter sp. O1-1]